MPVTYRPLVPQDWAYCIKVHHLAMRAYVEAIWGWDENQQDEWAVEFFRHREAIHEIALVSEEPIGYLSYEDMDDDLVLEQLYLHPDHQGQGYGSEILSRLIGLAHSVGKPLSLSVLTTNPRARAFYERYGFVVVNETAERVAMRRFVQRRS
jgi:GNAT superfamily N-acetyltransferase